MKDTYESPLSTRYASKAMQHLFSSDMKFSTWRRLWIALAEAEQAMGLPITDEQLNEMRASASSINYESAEQHEAIVRHDVMAHVHAYGEQCPLARPIIHLGATSCYVGDNTDLIIMVEGLKLIRRQIVAVLGRLARFAYIYRELPTLGFTHFQPAQLVTVGKRATLWMNDLVMDLEDLDHVLKSIRFLGSKGTTGTQASFMSLFDNDEDKVRQLDLMVARKMGFQDVYPVSGQTYSRKVDARVLSVLSGIAQSAHKFSNDLRLLQHLKEIEEPFEKGQIGSSAMAYKRNPMRSERMAALSRTVILNSANPAMTAAEQWFERTLDDSANKRLSVPESFLATDAILTLYLNVSGGLVVYPKVIARHVQEELPFMATENILMAAVRRGGDRQDLHERIRQHSMAAGNRVKADGLDNDLLERIAADPAFGLHADDLDRLLDPNAYIGRSVGQTVEFLTHVIEPILAQDDAGNDASEIETELKV